MAKLVDALDLGSSGATRESSTLSFRTKTYQPKGVFMQVTVEQLSGLERKITVKLPAEEINKEIEKRLKDLVPKVKIDGFRPGKVPESVVRQRYMGALRGEVLSDVIQNSYYKALEQENLHPAGMPKIDVIKDEGQDVEFSAEVEIYPQLELKSLTDVEIEKYKVEISDAAVDEVIDKLRRQHAEWNDVDRITQKGDRIVLDFESRIHGQPFEGGTGKNASLDLGAGSAIADFEHQLVGVQPRTSIDFSIKFPDNYPRAELAGKSAMVNAIIHQVMEPTLPELDDEFLKKVGIAEGGMDKLRTDVRENMQRELENASRNHVRSQIIDKILVLNPIELPHGLVTDEVNNLRQQAEAQSKKGAPKPNDQQLQQAAERRVRLGLIFSEVIKHKKIKVDPARVEAMLQTMAASFGDPTNVLAWYRQDKNQMRQLESAVLEEQVIEEIGKDAKFVEKQTSYGEAIKELEQGA